MSLADQLNQVRGLAEQGYSLAQIAGMTGLSVGDVQAALAGSWSGLTGSASSGTTGPGGPTGPAGPAGPQGPAGPTGPAGPAGPAGAQGPKGDTGSVGPQGVVGPDGAQGPAGPVGLTGPTGSAGPAGPKGDPGPTGPTGATGPMGPAGSAGAAGATGPAGPQGPTGLTGAQGPIGSQGATGQAGTRGSLWFHYTGAGVPPTGTFAGEADGDYALRTSDGEVFKHVSGAWADQGFSVQGVAGVAARMVRAAAMNTVVGWGKIPLDTIDFDTSSLCSVANGRITINADGRYHVAANLMCSGTANANTDATCGVYVNGVSRSVGSRVGKFTSVGVLGVSASDVLSLHAGDFIELWSNTASALALNVATGEDRNFLSVGGLG